MSTVVDDTEMSAWDDQERAAEAMIPVIGELYRERDVEISVFGQLMVKRAVADILKAHELARQVEHVELSPRDTLAVVSALSTMPLRHAHIDIGKLAAKYASLPDRPDHQEFLTTELHDAMNGHELPPPKDVVLYGFGRIGRLLARLLCDRTGGGRGMRLRAVVVRKGQGNDLEKRAGLLRFDSVHCRCNGVVKTDTACVTMTIN
ncbi:MAG: glyceraldehyde 3-phosphate dehydrogenase NAD-binding domain-containing protein [Gammaproteobacteria bacterium]